MYKNNLIAENEIITTASDSFMLKIFAVVILPYLTFTMTKVKIKLPSYFFPNSHGWIYFFENLPGIFHFFSLPLEIPDKTKLNSWLFQKIVLDP